MQSETRKRELIFLSPYNSTFKLETRENETARERSRQGWSSTVGSSTYPTLSANKWNCTAVIAVALIEKPDPIMPQRRKETSPLPLSILSLALAHSIKLNHIVLHP